MTDSTLRAMRALIADRLTVMQAYRTDHHKQYHETGVIRGLLWAMNGWDPGDLRGSKKVLDLAKIPYEEDGEAVLIPDTWLREHGL